MLQLICHLFGDYLFQTDKQALGKKKNIWLAIQHAFTYTLPFLFITHNILTLLIIMLTHVLIDHNHFIEAIRGEINGVDTENGFHPDRPIWITVWLNIIADNAVHLLINYLAITYVG